jgi:hypothetical protein
LVEETGVPGENMYTSPRVGFELSTCKSSYHAITIMTSRPKIVEKEKKSILPAHIYMTTSSSV